LNNATMACASVCSSRSDRGASKVQLLGSVPSGWSGCVS
jgi:hypothetical protein